MPPRSNNSDKILVLENEQEVFKDKVQTRADLGVDGFIRIRENEFVNIDKGAIFLAHFNLQHTSHEVGKVYGLVKILRNGHYSGVDSVEVLPLLDLSQVYIAEGVEVQNHLSYEDLTNEHFKHSLPNIKNVDNLKDVICDRYCESMPNLNKEEIVKLGVGFTLLKFKSI